MRRSVKIRSQHRTGRSILYVPYYGTEQNKGKYELLLNILGTQSLGWRGEEFKNDELSTTRAWLRSKANSMKAAHQKCS